ncbi:MAG: 1,4-alpha-glucan branching protein GlgB [Desulfobulbaceae bacterium]|nr:1,4-alpha-glucan branching protein GlgB [Desulfobulbaceae bacterium]HIJ77841.1 1,4-alpha-glucan branching protein GlgB [Deltaproteobacteria bacterium]
MSLDLKTEFDRIIDSEHHDPFRVLGFHVLDQDTTSSVVRTFQPHATACLLVVNDEKKVMYKTRKEGLFEIVIPDCNEPFAYHFEATFYDETVHIIKDPYRFMPLMSEYDCYLFNTGTNYEIYNKLGAHQLTAEGIKGTVFRVWAPSARRVSVLGNFNYWDGRVHQMRVLGKSGVWELFIPDIAQGEPYKFEIKTQNMSLMEKADPFQFHGEVRPKTASIVWSLDDYNWADAKWLDKRKKHPQLERPMAIYEVHLGSWRRDPADPTRMLSFQELAAAMIPYVKEMGFTHIELMPIMEHPLDESWGYQTTGYYSVTSRHGTPQDFMNFVDLCHQNDIGVILDWVPSHFPTDGHALSYFDGTALYEHQDPRQGAHPEWGTLIFNYGRKEVQNFLIANALFWIEKFHIDGFRVDAVASMLYLDYGRQDGEWIPNCYGGKENIDAIDFLRHLNSIVYGKHPDTMMIAEESTSFFGVSKPADMGGLGFGYKWNMGWMNDTLGYFSKDPIYRKYHQNALTFSLLYAFTENFILPLSHDEVVHGKQSLLFKMPGDMWQKFANLRLLYFYMWTHPGKKLLFMGMEFAQISEWYCKVSLDWHLPEQMAQHKQMQDFVKSLNKIYRDNPSLWEVDFVGDGFAWMDFKDVDSSILSYARYSKDKKEHVVCLLNFTPQVMNDYRVGVPEAGIYQEIFCSDLKEFGGSGVWNGKEQKTIPEPFGEAANHIRVSVPPLGGIILKKIVKK